MKKVHLTQDELWTYSRQLVLPEIGHKGQVKLKESSVLLAGVGGLGTPIAYQLAAMGIGHLTLVDRDIISFSDLHRQYLYDSESIGLPKVEVASTKLRKLNPKIHITPIPTSIKPWNIEKLLENVNVVVDGLDSIETRFILNRACVNLGIPYIYGGAIRTQGAVSTIIPYKTPCLECFYSGLTDSDLSKCAVVGVYTPVLGIVASIEVSETIKLLTGKPPYLQSKLLYVDTSTYSLDIISIPRYENCPVCGSQPSRRPLSLHQKLIEEECSRDGRTTFVITPNKWIELDLQDTETSLIKMDYTLEKKGDLGITMVNTQGVSLSLLKTGVATFKFPPQEKPLKLRKKALHTYTSLVKIIESFTLSQNDLQTIITQE